MSSLRPAIAPVPSFAPASAPVSPPAPAPRLERTSQRGVRPLFFNGQPQQLFGVYYEPASRGPAGPPVLICPPVGHEYVRSYNAIRRLCRRLAQSGLPVFKFDYCGLGDSYGDGSEATAAEWQANIRAAARELARLSGRSELTVVGVRLGGLLAAGTLLEGLVARDLVLWDPVVNGADYLAELRRLHRLCVDDTLRFRRSQLHRMTDGEFVGFRFPDRLQESIAGLRLQAELASKIEAASQTSHPAAKTPPAYSNCFLVVSSQTAEYESLADSLHASFSGRFSFQFVAEPAGWGCHCQVETPLSAQRAVAAINARISSEFV